MQPVLDETLLLGIATIAVAVAGFTAVTAALTPPGGSWSASHRIRQRAIVSTSFNVVFEGLAPIIVYSWLADARASIAISSAAATIYLGSSGVPTVCPKREIATKKCPVRVSEQA